MPDLDIYINEAVVRQGFAELIDPLQLITAPPHSVRLLHEADPESDTGEEGGAGEPNGGVLVREGAMQLTRLPRRKGPGEADTATVSMVYSVQCPAGATEADERQAQQTVTLIVRLLDGAEWEAADGTLLQIDSAASEDGGAQQTEGGDHAVAYAIVRVSATVSKCDDRS